MCMLLVDALAFKSINDPIKNQMNSCAAICVKQDDPCHFLRVLYGMVANRFSCAFVIERSDLCF